MSLSSEEFKKFCNNSRITPSQELIDFAIALSTVDLEGLSHAPIQVWEAHPLISSKLDAFEDREIVAAIQVAEAIAPQAPKLATGYSLDLSDNAAFGYAAGDRNWLGLAIIPSHRETTFVICKISYEDKDLAKAQGAKWDRKIGWNWEVADIKAACNQIKKILADTALSEAISHKNEIALYCTKKSEFERNWCAQIAGDSIPKKVAAQPETLQDIVINHQIAEDLRASSKYFCGIAESEEGIEGLIIKAPFQHKEQIKWIASYSGGGNAKWLADKKLWLIPLECAEMLQEGHRHQKTAIKFFEGFTFSPKAKPYFDKAIAAGLI